MSNVNPEQKKRVQAFLVSKGFNLGTSGPLRNGVDGDDGQKTWDALEQHLGIKTQQAPSAIVPANGALINRAAFLQWAPKALPGTYEALEATAHKWGLSGLPLIHWLGQMYVESQGFSTLTENLNYNVEGLKLFGSHRITQAQRLQYGRTPTRKADQVAIANIVYGGQWGKENLGNRLDHPNDGWDMRGAGFKQLTGYENITEYLKTVPGKTVNDLRTDVNLAADGAAWYFLVKKPACKQEALQDDVEGVTRAVNGGINGLEDRKVRTQQARSVVNA